jgi:tRNA pseudouridine55 synthase
MAEVNGFAVVDKPAGWTSHDIVAKARGILGTKRVGHSGTLDPGATGVLLLGVGRATRVLRFLDVLPKSYECDVVLGAETTTLDDGGDVIATYDMVVTLDDVRQAGASFVGAIEQVPPMVSAVKVEGRRLHELARAGIEVERQPRPVTVHSLAVVATEDPLVFGLSVTCSSGTYVRTLAADIGHALGGGAHLRALRRTAIGPHTLAEASVWPAVELRPPADAVCHLAAVTTDQRDLVATGRLPEVAFDGEGPWAVLDPEGVLLAVAERVGGRVKPSVVLLGPSATAGSD